MVSGSALIREERTESSLLTSSAFRATVSVVQPVRGVIPLVELDSGLQRMALTHHTIYLPEVLDVPMRVRISCACCRELRLTLGSDAIRTRIEDKVCSSANCFA